MQSIKLSVTVLLGIGGADKSREHARLTGKLLSAIDPDYVGALTTMVVNGTVVNNTTCNFEDCTNLQPPTGQLRDAEVILEPSPAVGESIDMGLWSEDIQAVEAIVPNGLLMTVVEPPVRFGRISFGP